MSTNFVFLDLETTGDEPLVHGVIQIGLTNERGDTFAVDVHPGNSPIQQEAMNINGFTAERMAAAPSLEVVVPQVLNWLDFNTLGKPVTVGWNVGTFDMQFLKRLANPIFKRFYYHTVELNSEVYTLAKALGLGTGTVKKAAKDYANEQLEAAGVPKLRHDAGYDSAASRFEWDYFIRLAAGENMRSPEMQNSAKRQVPLFS